MKVESSLREKLFLAGQGSYLALENTSVVSYYLLSDCLILEQNISQISLYDNAALGSFLLCCNFQLSVKLSEHPQVVQI